MKHDFGSCCFAFLKYRSTSNVIYRCVDVIVTVQRNMTGSHSSYLLSLVSFWWCWVPLVGGAAVVEQRRPADCCCWHCWLPQMTADCKQRVGKGIGKNKYYMSLLLWTIASLFKPYQTCQYVVFMYTSLHAVDAVADVKSKAHKQWKLIYSRIYTLLTSCHLSSYWLSSEALWVTCVVTNSQFRLSHCVQASSLVLLQHYRNIPHGSHRHTTL